MRVLFALFASWIGCSGCLLFGAGILLFLFICWCMGIVVMIVD